MFRSPFPARRLAAALVLLALAAQLAACSRKNNILTPAITGTYTWRNGIQHILADRSEGTKPTGCTSCHHAGTGIPDWSDYTAVAGEDSATFRYKITNLPMSGFLKTGEAQILSDWKNASSPY